MITKKTSVMCVVVLLVVSVICVSVGISSGVNDDDVWDELNNNLEKNIVGHNMLGNDLASNNWNHIKEFSEDDFGLYAEGAWWYRYDKPHRPSEDQALGLVFAETWWYGITITEEDFDSPVEIQAVAIYDRESMKKTVFIREGGLDGDEIGSVIFEPSEEAQGWVELYFNDPIKVEAATEYAMVVEVEQTLPEIYPASCVSPFVEHGGYLLYDSLDEWVTMMDFGFSYSWMMEMKILPNPPTVDTLPATGHALNTVVLNADYNMGGTDELDVYFEYRKLGETDWMEVGRETQNESGSYNYTVTGLDHHEEYEFRGALDYNVDNTVYGDILPFIISPQTVTVVDAEGGTPIQDAYVSLRSNDIGDYWDHPFFTDENGEIYYVHATSILDSEFKYTASKVPDYSGIEGSFVGAEHTIMLEESYPDDPEEGLYVDNIRLEIRGEIGAGIGDTVSGTLDAFIQAVDGSMYSGLSDEWKDELDALEAYGIYSELTYNTAWTEDCGYVVDTIGAGDPADFKFNPFAIREVRFATNFLLDRQHIVEEILDGYGIPQYQAIGTRNLAYDEELRQIDEKYGLTYAGDFQKGYDMIQDAMTDAMNDPNLTGEMRSKEDSPTGFWQYRAPGQDWEDVEITGMIRVDDSRLQVGRYFSDLMEDCGIKVDRFESDRELILIWLFDDPADFTWGFYTGGWIASVTLAHEHSIPVQFYTDYNGFMPGGFIGESCRYLYRRDEPYAQSLIDDWAVPLMSGQIVDEETYWDHIRHISDVGVYQSARIFIENSMDMVPVNEKSVVEVATDTTTGWSQVFSPRTLKTQDGNFTAAQYSPQGALYMDNWNNIAGSNCYYGRLQQRMAKDYGTVLHPSKGASIPMRADFIDDDGVMMIEMDYHFDADGVLVKELPIPDNDNVWFYCVQDEEWINGGHEYVPIMDGWIQVGADRAPVDTVATAVTYNYHLGTWHSGHAITLRDILAWHAFSKQLSYGEEWGAVGDKYFHSMWGTQNRPYNQNIKAIEVIDAEEGILKFYGDYTFPAEVQIAGYYADFPDVPWQLYEAVSHLRGETEYADSGATIHDRYEWTNIAGTNYVHWLSQEQTTDFRNTLGLMAAADWIPPYLQTGPTPITVFELWSEISHIRDFQSEYGHSWISQGPFKITVHEPHNLIMEYERWTQEDGYPFPVYHWTDVLSEKVTCSLELTSDGDGWNFVSFNIDGVDTELTAILEDIDGNYDRVMWYDASTDEWLTYVPGRPDHFNNMEIWDHTMGIWIRMTEDATLTVEGYQPTSTDITLYPGWNMVGLPSQSAGNHDLPADVTRIGFFDATEQYNIAYTDDVDTFIFEPGKGYWLYNDADEAVIWTVEY